MDEIWFAPHRDGMLRIDARLSHIGPQESIIIELLATGKLVSPDEIANKFWPGKRPDNWHHLIRRRMVRVRKLLPRDYVMTVYEPQAKLSFSGLLAFKGPFHAFAPTIGWQLTGKINVHPAAGAAGD